MNEVLFYVRVSNDFYRRRGGVSYAAAVLKFRFHLLATGFCSVTDFMVGGLGHAFVIVMPGAFREWFYKKFLRR